MANYDAHIEQAKKNLKFLTSITHINNYEWQVTVCFYIAVHLINAHLAKIVDQHYRSHGQVDLAINSKNRMSPAKLSDELYLAYNKLYNLSRRARYLIHDDPKNIENTEFFTYSKHLEKSLKNLDKLLLYFKVSYKVSFDKLEIKCIDLKGKYQSDFFIIV